jgi:hypothetical protein
MNVLLKITPRGILNLSLCFIMLALVGCASTNVDRNVAGEGTEKSEKHFKGPPSTGRSINQY